MTDQINTDSLRKYLIQGASGSLILKIANTVLTLSLAIVLARALGVENFGIYAFCLAVVRILVVPAMLGGQQILVREVSAYRVKSEFSLLKGLLLFFRKASLIVSIILALTGVGIGYRVYENSPMLVSFLLAMGLVPLLTIINLQEAALRSLRHVLLGQVGTNLRPGLVIILVGVMFWITRGNLGPEVAITAELAASSILVTMIFYILKNRLPKELKKIKAEYDASKWIASSLPFIIAGSMQILNSETSVVMLGILQSPVDVGIFRVAQRGAILVPFGLQAVNMTIGPTISELFAQGKKERLQQLISKSVVAVLAFALPVTLFLVFGGKWIISRVFGPEFSPAYIPLIILCFGQLFNAGMGSVGLILNMARLERFTARGVAVAAGVSVILNFGLIPFLGAIGAAIATSISLVIWNVLLFNWLYKETGIVSSFRWVKY